MRKTITTLLAVGALAAAGLSASAAAPPSAHAAGCSQWVLPYWFDIYQSNGYRVGFAESRGTWYAAAFPRSGGSNLHSRSVRFHSITSDYLAFNIVWENGSEGVYTGTIRSDGSMSGTAVDRWHRSSRASWSTPHRAWCARWS